MALPRAWDTDDILAVSPVGRSGDNWRASWRYSLAASELAGTLETIAQSYPEDEETMVQRGKVTCPTMHGQLIVKWDRIQVSVILTCLPINQSLVRGRSAGIVLMG